MAHDDEAGLLPVLKTPRMVNEDEKPLFHINQRPSAPSEPFLLSEGCHQVPYTINRYLRDYQREGVKFIYDSYAKARGCILGDDMGLGKTVQVISFLAAVLQKTGTWEDVENNRPEFLQSQKSSTRPKFKKVFLIVAPLSVLYNWKDELDTWGYFKTAIVHGVRKDDELDRVNRGRCEIALTTYETLRLCLEQFNSINWAAVIVDEAHKLKNNKSQITQSMKKLRCKVRVGLTGTILQNNLEELWCVMDWAVPGCLGSLGSFKNRFSDPIEHGHKYSVTKRALAEGRRAVHSLAKRLSRWFLRRTKALISDQLPKKDDRVVYCSLTDFQQTVYRAVLDTDDVTLLLRSSERCPCSSGRPRKKCCYKLNSDGVPVRHLYFSYLAILRKVANHVALLQSREGTSEKQEKYVAAICEHVFKKCPEFTERCKEAAFEAMSDPIYSGKMKVLQKLLNHFFTRKNKVLLFSYSTKLLDVLESYCMAEGLEYRRLDGNTKSKERIHIVKEFNSSSDINLCLVSTMAGGLGLNFVGANVVVLFDPTWNPANDLQAVDRAYRIGQCKDVTVFRLVSLGTVEEIIYLRQIYKQQLQSSVIGNENARRYFEAVQGAEGQAGELFGIRNLFRMQTDGTCLTHQILEREGRVEAGIMTASTQAAESRTQEPNPEPVAGEEANEPAVKSNTNGQLTSAGVMDFSSASEDEDPCNSKLKASESRAVFIPSAICSANMGLSALLQKHAARRTRRSSDSSEESQSDENREDLVPKDPRAAMGKGWSLSSDSEGEKKESPGRGECGSSSKKSSEAAASPDHADHHDSMEESEDIDVLQHQYTEEQQEDREEGGKEQKQKLPKFAAGRRGRKEEYESSNSSEDDAPVRTMKSKKSHLPSPLQSKSTLRRPESTHNAAQKSVKFTRLKTPATRLRIVPENAQIKNKSSTGNIDALLGGLKEVSYTHSNQRVVGSSRMENQLSRAALRDVFELKQHSQLPANRLFDISESGISQSHTDGGEESPTPADHDGPHLQHQVTHSLRTSHHTPNTTISVGGTPDTVRKQQFEEMARFFGAKSMQEFAEELVRSSSAQRLSRLRKFYSRRNPDLCTIIQQIFPEPVNEPKPPVSPTPSTSQMTRRRPTSKRTLLNSVQRPPEEESEKAEDERGTSKKKRNTKARNHENIHHHHMDHSQLKNKNLSSSPETSQSSSKPSLRPTDSQHFKARVPSAELVPLSKADQTETDSVQTNKTLITDLIGDTSILDDIFKTKRSADRPKPATAPLPSPTERSKSKGKDFWDILNEGNEESINKLTDLSQVEKLCSASGKSRSENKLDNSQLWKKNEKFLWKR